MNDFLQSLRNGQAEKPRTPKTRKNYDNSYQYTNSPPRFYGGYPNNRNQGIKRPPISQQPGNQIPMDETTVTSMLADAIENLSSHIETLAKNQDYMISVQERTADMLERQAIAIERIVAHLNIAPAQEETRDLPEEEPVMEQPFENHYVTSRRPEPVMAEPVETAVETVSEPARPVIRKRKKVSARPVEKAVQEKPVQSDKKLLGREIIMDIIHTMRADGATFDQVASHLIELGQPTFSGRGEWHAQTIHRLCNKK